MATTKDPYWIEHVGRRVLYRDYRGLTGQELVDKVHAYNKHTQSVEGGGHLMLIDVSGASVDREGLGAFKSVAASNRAKVKKTAVVGLEGVQRVFLEVVRRFSAATIQSFDNLDSALNWLVKD